MEEKTMMEQLFVQLFDRKRQIVDQVKRQAQLFDQHLAATLLIDGIPLPPWLLPQPHPSDPTELKKEELISGLLFPFPQAPAPYSISRNSLYDQPIFAADGKQRRVFTAHGSPEARGETSVLPEVVGTHGCSSSGAPGHPAKSPGECPVNNAPEPIPTPVPKSPRDQREPSVPESYYSLGQSLARVQRSKSRQKNIELRNSVKASKSSLHDECNAGVEPRRFAGSGDARTLIDHMDDMELVRPTVTDCSIHIMEEPKLVDCRSGGMGCMNASDRSMDPIASGLQPLCVDESVKHGSPEKNAAQVLESSLKSNSRALEVVESPSIRSIIEDSRGKQKNSSSHCANISRSQCSTRPFCEDELLNLADSCLFDRDATILTEEVSHVDTAGKSEESSRKQEPEVEFCQLDGDGLSGWHESSVIDGTKVHDYEDKSIQLQQIDAGSGQEAEPTNVLVSVVKQPTSAAVDKLTSDQLQSAATQENVSGTRVDALSGNRDDAESGSRGTNDGEMMVVSDEPNDAEMMVVSDEPSEGFSAPIRSNMAGDNLRTGAEVLLSGLRPDRNLQIESKQIDFDDAAEFESGLNGIACTASEERVQDVPAPGLSNSLDLETGDRENSHLFSTEPCVEETGEGSRITRQDASVHAKDALEGGRCPNSAFSQERETSKSRFSVFVSKSILPSDGENVLQHPVNVVEPSSLSSLKSSARMDLSAKRSSLQFDTAKPSKLGSPESKVGYSADIGPKVSAELKIRDPEGSNMSIHPDLILGDCAAEVHFSDMIIDNSVSQSADSVQNSSSGLQDVGCSELDDHNIAGDAVLSEHKSGPHSGSSRPQSRQRSVRNRQAERPTSSATWKKASLESSHRNSEVRNLGRVECHQEDAPSPDKTTRAHDGNALHSNASCCPVNLDEPSLDDYAIERFQSSPMQQDGESDLAPSGDVLDPRMCTIYENKDPEHAEDESESGDGDGERSASSEGPIEGTLSHREESSKLSHLVDSHLSPTRLTDVDQTMPVLEGFFMKSGDNIVEHACFMERLCKSTALHTPSTQLSTAGPLHRGSNLYRSVPNGLLEYIDLKSTQPLEDDIIGLFEGGFFKKDIGHALGGKSFSDCLPVSDAETSRKPYASPVGKFWEKITSNSGSSKKKASLIPELPCISEENEISDEATGTSANEISVAVMTGSVKRKPLADITEDHNCPASVSELENHRYSLESVSTEISSSAISKRPKQKLGTHKRSKKRHGSKMRDSKAIPRGVRDTKMSTGTLRNSVSQAKTSLQRDGLGTSRKEAKRGNIVSNMTSFVPLVRQKQAAVALTGKRDVKVKALEAADAARRQAETREAERKMKKEALKLERARMEQENIRLLELEKKRKEEEKKKKEAEIASRKRLREEEERREKDRKRKRVEDARKHQELQKDKLCSKKEEKQIRKKAMIADDKKDANLKILSENKGAKIQGSETVPEDGSLVPETPRHCSDNLRVTSFFNQGKNESFKEDEIKEQSYDISPYQCSDDEDEDEDDNAPRKFIPSWASKNRIALAISSQNSVDPDLIFARDSFCSIDEVVLPRKLRLN